MPVASPQEHYGYYLKSWMDEQTEQRLDPEICSLTKWVSAWLSIGYPVDAYQSGKSIQQLCNRLSILHVIHKNAIRTKDYSVCVYDLASHLNLPLKTLQNDLDFLHDYGLALPDIDKEGCPVISLTVDGTRLLSMYVTHHPRLMH